MDNSVQEFIIGNILGALWLRQHSSSRDHVKVIGQYSDLDKMLNWSNKRVALQVESEEDCNKSPGECNIKEE